MRPTRHHKKTHRGLGTDGDEAPVDETPAPPSSRGVIAVPPSEPSPGRYSVRPARHETREFTSPVGPSSEGRRVTVRMPTPVDAITITPKIQRTGVVPRLLPRDGELEGAPLGSREALVLSLIDGRSSVESLVDTAGMSRVEVVVILDRLAERKLIALE